MARRPEHRGAACEPLPAAGLATGEPCPSPHVICPRLPTYHFAHAVDDHLMGVTIVICGDEWISSVPLHL
ncbi:glutamate--tRNA ligase family protein [Streptosporangium subroseum]|uniref:glutamate--tRNA ligase family protein n=1 Tax=Streptosporangium subroseum TaxID=106412 RepID=UPI001C52A953